ncbi:MAG: elongation factor P [Planctomycetota bacterium]|jgi:elongation factor P
MQANDIRKGSILIHKGELWQAVDVTHRTPGNWRAFVQVKLRNVKSGIHTTERFQSTENVEPAWLDKRKAEYLYDDPNSGPVFMDLENYEQYGLSREILGDAMNYVKPNAEVEVTFYEGTPIGLFLPANVELEIKETEPATKGNTVSNVQKPALLETGHTVKVPAHISAGDVIRVSTVTGEFQERVNK